MSAPTMLGAHVNSARHVHECQATDTGMHSHPIPRRNPLMPPSVGVYVHAHTGGKTLHGRATGGVNGCWSDTHTPCVWGLADTAVMGCMFAELDAFVCAVSIFGRLRRCPPMLRTSSKPRRGQVQIAGTRRGRSMRARPALPLLLHPITWGGRGVLAVRVCVVGRAWVRVP